VLESLTFAVKVKVPARDGDPDRRPEELRVSPSRLPVCDHLYGLVPPAAVRRTE
jgi:hypothetical protein